MRRESLDGWKHIAAHVSARTGFSVGVDAVAHMSKRVCDPLPVRRWGRRRPRVVADVAALDRWIDGEWRDAADHGAGGSNGAA